MLEESTFLRPVYTRQQNVEQYLHTTALLLEGGKSKKIKVTILICGEVWVIVQVCGFANVDQQLQLSQCSDRGMGTWMDMAA